MFKSKEMLYSLQTINNLQLKILSEHTVIAVDNIQLDNYYEEEFRKHIYVL